MRRPILASLCAVGCGASSPPRPMTLERVILYQNGIGYFERAGHVRGETVRLELGRHELDDVLKTLTVLDRLGAAVTTVEVPELDAKDRTIALGVRMSGARVHDVKVSYAVPTPTWKAAYRIVLDGDAQAKALLQGWAMVNNASQEDWTGVQLTLATGAPMSFVHDLHTPEYVKRPDLRGNLVAPAVLGPIQPEKLGAHDTDRDGIPDVDDRCPDEPETFNGFEDDDGCPDRGRVVVGSTSIEVLDQIYFARGTDTIRAESRPILDAVAATLRGNPDLTKIEIGGHASRDEDEGWVLAARRAAAIRAALVQRGVEPHRLAVVPYGATRPVDPRDTDSARARNRRADFLIAARREPAVRPGRRPASALDPETARASVHAATRPIEVAGMVRYALSEPVTIKKGSSSMVSILNQPIGAHDVYLFRPDRNAPGSDRHPFRAVRLVNDTAFMLEPGPLAIFARGSFVGDTNIGRLAVGETAWVPYALDGATTVTTETTESERPIRIVAIQRGVVTAENAGVRVTRYTVAAGRGAKTIYLRHPKQAGYTARELPPGTQDRGDAYLVPLPLQPGNHSVLALEERQARRVTLELKDTGARQLELYVEGSSLPPEVADRVRHAVALRAELATREEKLDDARERLAELATRADELRETLRTVEKVRDAGVLRKTLVESLAQVTSEADRLAKQLGEASEAIATARGKLADALREITLAEP
jgi:outer membrane protein OmpA-like peptidoglycan-associated protein